MKKNMLGVIGCGNMGGAIVRGLILKGIILPETILLNDKEPEKSAKLSKETGCGTMDLAGIIAVSDKIVLAVKPQDSNALFEIIGSGLIDQTVISIMAGVKIKTIKKKVGKDVSVVRAMPNLGALIYESMTGIAFGDKEHDREGVKKIFSGIGDVVEVDEASMDAVTAVSGSGPAYFFYLARSMIRAALDMGLDKDIAERLVRKTLFGASKFLVENPDDTDELIKKVASKGGTTEAALDVFDAKNLEKVIVNAIVRAKERSRELSEE
ncbi:MAG: pyrroline-5-carboxylate reductase [Candidatus Omnitrophica bacterium]|nr:pyrroline-5-carboxylate reductase [Candidatus Omnitrophota bacterium]